MLAGGAGARRAPSPTTTTAAVSRSAWPRTQQQQQPHFQHQQLRRGMSAAAAAAAGQQVPAGAAEGGGAPSAAPPAVDVEAVAAKHGWDLGQRNDWSHDPRVQLLPVATIRRPLAGARSNDPEKVAALMRSVADIGLQEPIDVLEVEGQYWGFSGCHRFEAHQRLGKEQILCRVRKATPQVLKFHMM